MRELEKASTGALSADGAGGIEIGGTITSDRPTTQEQDQLKCIPERHQSAHHAFYSSPTNPYNDALTHDIPLPHYNNIIMERTFDIYSCVLFYINVITIYNRVVVLVYVNNDANIIIL